MLVINFLLQLAIRGEGTLLRHLAGSVVVELQLSAASTVLHYGLLCEQWCCTPYQDREESKAEPNTRWAVVMILSHVSFPLTRVLQLMKVLNLGS
jgi:hypothetical protein